MVYLCSNRITKVEVNPLGLDYSLGVTGNVSEPSLMVLSLGHPPFLFLTVLSLSDMFSY